MKVDSLDLARRLYREIYTNDEYQLSHIPASAIRKVIDIGANVGYFSVRCCALFPQASIWAVEPCAGTYQMLVENVSGTPIQVLGFALGPAGAQLSLVAGRDSGQNQLVVNDEGYICASTLSEIVRECGGIVPGTLLKIDTEGAEKCLIHNARAYTIMRACQQVAMEIHFAQTEMTWGQWRPIIEDIFSETHNLYMPAKPHAVTIIATKKKIK